MAIVEVNDDNFDAEVLQSIGLVLVDFGAAWCHPCSRQLPIIEKFAADNTNVKVCQVDIDDAPHTAALLKIRSVPTIILFNNGVRVDMKVGLSSAEAITTLLKKVSP